MFMGRMWGCSSFLTEIDMELIGGNYSRVLLAVLQLIISCLWFSLRAVGHGFRGTDGSFPFFMEKTVMSVSFASRKMFLSNDNEEAMISCQEVVTKNLCMG